MRVSTTTVLRIAAARGLSGVRDNSRNAVTLPTAAGEGAGFSFGSRRGAEFGILAKLGDDRARRFHGILPPYGAGMRRRGELHAAIVERARLGRTVVENLDVGMTQVVGDRTEHPLQSLGRAFQPLEETALVVKHEPGDQFGPVARLRRERELMQVGRRHGLSGAASIHQRR